MSQSFLFENDTIPPSLSVCFETLTSPSVTFTSAVYTSSCILSHHTSATFRCTSVTGGVTGGGVTKQLLIDGLMKALDGEYDDCRVKVVCIELIESIRKLEKGER